MFKPVVLAAAAAATMLAHAQTPKLTPAEQAEKVREAEKKGEALFIMLKDPSRCGAPAAKGYACAVVIYRAVTEEKDRLPEVIAARVTAMTKTDGPAKDVRVRVLSPFDGHPNSVSLIDMTELRLSLTSDKRGAEFATLQMTGVLGYAENEALPAGDKRKLDRQRFKLPH